MPPTPPQHDEISLRDLYLVVRQGALAILAFALLAAVVAGAWTASRPTHYRAEATTAVARAPISVQQEFGLAFRPELDVTYDTYQTLAYSRGVLERLLSAVPTSGLTLGGIRDALSLERLAGAANQPSSLLAVAHHVRHGDAELAAEIASSWATITIETVRSLLNENLDAIERITIEGVAEAAVALDRADAELSELREAHDATAGPQRLLDVQARLNDLDDRADELQRLVSGREAEAASLGSRLEIDGDALVVLTDAPDVALTLAGALWASEARLESLRAEHAVIEAQRGALRAEIARLSVSVARYEGELARLTRAVERAENALASLARIEPTVAYVAQLAPTGARLLSDAAVPTRPESRRTLLNAVLAAAVATFAALVLVLLREAVRDPEVPSGRAPPRPGRGAGQPG